MASVEPEVEKPATLSSRSKVPEPAAEQVMAPKASREGMPKDEAKRIAAANSTGKVLAAASIAADSGRNKPGKKPSKLRGSMERSVLPSERNTRKPLPRCIVIELKR